MTPLRLVAATNAALLLGITSSALAQTQSVTRNLSFYTHDASGSGMPPCNPGFDDVGVDIYSAPSESLSIDFDAISELEVTLNLPSRIEVPAGIPVRIEIALDTVAGGSGILEDVNATVEFQGPESVPPVVWDRARWRDSGANVWLLASPRTQATSDGFAFTGVTLTIPKAAAATGVTVSNLDVAICLFVEAGSVDPNVRFSHPDLPLLTRKELLLPGDDCADGGFAAISGIDDGIPAGTPVNGQLEPGEEDASYLRCFTPTTLLRSSSIASGQAGCAIGGTQYDYGEDDGDGGGTPNNRVLEEGEIDDTIVICDPVPTVFRTVPIAAGTDGCAAGGSRIELGADDGTPSGVAGNGVLEDGEVDLSTTVCNGEAGTSSDGHDALVSTSTVDAGDADCVHGGTLIEVGVDDGGDGSDTADDGVLGASEVDSTSTVCNGAPGADGTDGTDGTDGCATAGEPGGAWLALIGLLGLTLRRRRPRPTSTRS